MPFEQSLQLPDNDGGRPVVDSSYHQFHLQPDLGRRPEARPLSPSHFGTVVDANGAPPPDALHSSLSPSCLPNCVVEAVAEAEHQGPWSTIVHHLPSPVAALGAEELVSTIQDAASQAASYVHEHPLEAMGLASGALVGGVVAVVCAPVELTAAGVVGVGLAGAAVVDGAAYLLHNQLDKAFTS